jgi:hypothetical protein
MIRPFLFAVLVIAAVVRTAALATSVPFIEDFIADAAAWRNGTGTADLEWASTGGRDGGSYASGPLNFLSVTPDGTPLVARAQEEWNSSSGAFAVNYIEEQVQELRVWVRHDAPAPLTYFIRFSGPGNFPGAVAVHFAPVLPGAWTQIIVPIDPGNPQFVTFEGSSFPAVFSNVGHIQIGLFEPAPLAGRDLTAHFDVDKVALLGGAPPAVPAVSSAGMAALMLVLGAAIGLRFRRRRPSYC